MLFPRNSARNAPMNLYEKGLAIKQELSDSSFRTSTTSTDYSESMDASSSTSGESRKDRLQRQRIGRDQRRARKEMTKKAEGGDTHYMFLLGWYYLSGSEGFEQDDQMAFSWTERAHLAGDVKGTAVLGSMHLVGAGTDKDMKKAIRCLRAASVQCDLAAYHLGMIYLKGFPNQGIKADRPQAYRLLQLAASETCEHQILGPKLTADAKKMVRKLNEAPRLKRRST